MMRRWLIGCGLAVLLAAVAVAGLGLLGYLKVSNWNASRKARIKAQQIVIDSGIAQRREYLERHLSQETRGTIPSEFYTYDGFYDWWRMPLVFPYQLRCVDSRDSAHLAKHDPIHPVADPNKSSSTVLWGITRVTADNTVLVFERNSESAISYGLLQYSSGALSEFDEEAQMWAAAKKAGYSGENVLLTVDELFSAYYDYEKEFVGQSPRGDSLEVALQE